MTKQTPLTKEYFDKVIGGFAKSVDGRFKQVDKRFLSIDQKFDQQTKELKEYVSREISRKVSNLATMTAREFERMHEEFGKVHTKLDTIETKVDNHEKRIRRVEDAVGLPNVL